MSLPACRGRILWVGSTDDSLDDLDVGGECDGNLGEYSHWGDGDGDEGDV